MNDRNVEQAWGDVIGRDYKINKMGLKHGHLWHFHVSKEAPTMYRHGEMPQTPSRNSACWGVSLKCLHTNAYMMGNKYDESEICVQLQGYSLGRNGDVVG